MKRSLIALTMACAVPSMAWACPDYTQNGAQHTLSADVLYQGRNFTVRAGGPFNLANCSSVPGTGYVAIKPDFTLTVSKNAYTGRALEFKVTSNCDAVMLVNTPSAAWLFDDDSAGNLDPKIRIDSAKDGIYDVWVGTVENKLCDATLRVETF